MAVFQARDDGMRVDLLVDCPASEGPVPSLQTTQESLLKPTPSPLWLLYHWHQKGLPLSSPLATVNPLKDKWKDKLVTENFPKKDTQFFRSPQTKAITLRQSSRLSLPKNTPFIPFIYSKEWAALLHR